MLIALVNVDFIVLAVKFRFSWKLVHIRKWIATSIHWNYLSKYYEHNISSQSKYNQIQTQLIGLKVDIRIITYKITQNINLQWRLNFNYKTIKSHITKQNTFHTICGNGIRCRNASNPIIARWIWHCKRIQ